MGTSNSHFAVRNSAAIETSCVHPKAGARSDNWLLIKAADDCRAGQERTRYFG
jgi:hypothetical protein